jgi:hypothetical protein
MFDAQDDIIDKATLERMRAEVACLAENLQALTYHPDDLIKNGIKRPDRSTELYLSFWHEAEEEPIEPLA